jgi:hypothetical protein
MKDVAAILRLVEVPRLLTPDHFPCAPDPFHPIFSIAEWISCAQTTRISPYLFYLHCLCEWLQWHSTATTQGWLYSSRTSLPDGSARNLGGICHASRQSFCFHLARFSRKLRA